MFFVFDATPEIIHDLCLKIHFGNDFQFIERMPLVVVLKNTINIKQ